MGIKFSDLTEKDVGRYVTAILCDGRHPFLIGQIVSLIGNTIMVEGIQCPGINVRVIKQGRRELEYLSSNISLAESEIISIYDKIPKKLNNYPDRR